MLISGLKGLTILTAPLVSGQFHLYALLDTENRDSNPIQAAFTRFPVSCHRHFRRGGGGGWRGKEGGGFTLFFCFKLKLPFKPTLLILCNLT